MITARDELLHLIEHLTPAECERALGLLAPLLNPGPRCPDCGEDDLDRLVWDEDGEDVECQRCGFCWAPDTAHALPG